MHQVNARHDIIRERRSLPKEQRRTMKTLKRRFRKTVIRNERSVREAAAGPMLYPAPELPDDTLIGKVRFSTGIRKALNAAGMKTISEVREASDETLLSLPDFGKTSIERLYPDDRSV